LTSSNRVDGQLPPALNVRKPTSGIAAMEKVKEKERKSNILEKL